MTSETAKKLAKMIKSLDKIHWSDRDAREKVAQEIEKIGGPFTYGGFIYNDRFKPSAVALLSYQEALGQLNTVGSDNRNSDLGQHYQNMINLLG